MYCCTFMQSANACISLPTVCFCINNSENVTKAQQEQKLKGLEEFQLCGRRNVSI